MIPKKIHYIWLGPNKRSKLIRKCIASWYQLHPDWEVIEWNDNHFKFNECAFVKMAFKNNNWAYLSDYYRLKILFMHGGIYLDTDMLLVKPLDQLLKNETFWGCETDEIISCGIIGTNKGDQLIKSIIEYYNELNSTNWKKNTIPEIVTKVYNSGSYKNTTLYNKDYFYPYPAECRLNELRIHYKKYITPNTIGIHMWEYSWSYFSRYQMFLKNRQFLKSMVCFIKEAFTKSNTFHWNELKKTARIILKR